VLEILKRNLVTAGRFAPSAARKSLFRFARSIAPDEFEKFSAMYANAPSQSYLLSAICRRGFVPSVVVDVGAYRGEWSSMARSIWPDCEIIMIEPNLEQREHLKAIGSKLKATLYTDLIGAEDGREVTFHVMASGSSILPERSNAPRRAETRHLKTLNSILLQHQPVDLLKIDAQGYELEILNGGSQVLSNLQAVILEVGLLEINENCPLLHEVISYMHARDFVAYDILEFHRRPLDGALFQMDIFFVRQSASLRADKRFG